MKSFRLKLHDGFGAVFQQIIGAVGLSLHFNIHYYFDISDVTISGHGLNYNTITTLGALIDIASAFPLINNQARNIKTVVEDFNLDILKDDTIFTFKKVHRYIQKNNLMHVYTLGANYLKPYLTKFDTIYNNEYYNVAIHIRRGDITKREQYFSRIVDISYYEKFIETFENNYTSNKPCKFYIYTQQDFLAPHELDKLAQKNNVIIDVDIEDQNNVTKQIIDWCELFNADSLLISKSSYSYTAAFFSNCPVYYIPFWHTPCYNWINCNDFCRIIA